MEEITIREWVERFNSGEFDCDSHLTQLQAGWYDWFCSDRALPNKTRVLGKKVCKIADSRRFDKDKTYVFFKNNCPMVGPLYDQFSVCDINTGDVLFCIQHLEKGSHGCDKAHWEVYCRENDFRDPVINGTWNEVVKYFMN